MAHGIPKLRLTNATGDWSHMTTLTLASITGSVETSTARCPDTGFCQSPPLRPIQVAGIQESGRAKVDESLAMLP